MVKILHGLALLGVICLQPLGSCAMLSDLPNATVSINISLGFVMLGVINKIIVYINSL